MQTQIQVFKRHAFLQTECLRLASSLSNDELCLLLADIESLIAVDPTSNDLPDLINLGIKLSLLHPDIVLNMKTDNDLFGNHIVQTNIDGDEEQFWMAYILGSDFRPVYQLDKQHIVYGHLFDCKIVEFENGLVRIITGTKTTLLNYLFQNKPTEEVYLDNLFSQHIDNF